MKSRLKGLSATVAVMAAAALSTAACSTEPDDPDGAALERSDADVTANVASGTPEADCLWPVAGHNLARTHTSQCAEGITRESLDRLQPTWFHETDAEVTGAPAVDDALVYFGDWNGIVRAVERQNGAEQWQVQLPTSPHVYSGQMPTSPVLATVGGTAAVIAASGSTVTALATTDGTQLWSADLADPDDPDDPTEIEGSPVVAAGAVLVPSDVHGADGYRSGLVSLSLEDGSSNWRFDPEQGVPATGCGAVWGSPAVDTEADLVVVGTGNCNDEASWTEASEAIVGVSLSSGELLWTFQPHEKGNRNDWDFAGAANLFEIDGRPVAGLGNKDGSYYVVDRDSGELVWSAEAQRQTGTGDGFAFGGFIGALALVDGVLVGGTAVGDCPCQHAFDAGTGQLLWQSNAPSGTYAAAAGVQHEGDGFVFQTGVDQTLRAFDVDDGSVLWEATLPSISSSGPSLAGDELFIGVGFREPGSPATGGGGLQAFRVLAEGEAPPSSSSTTTPQGPAVTALAPSEQPCIGSPCEIPFRLKTPPPGTDPQATLAIEPDPLRIVIEASGLGEPKGWLDPDGIAVDAGATTFMVFMTPRDDKPELGSIVCTFTAGDPGCSATRIEVPADRWTRLSIVATTDADTPPTLQEGFDRLVTTHSFDPALEPA